MKPEILFFDCAGTLLHPAEPIGQVYARWAAEFGLSRDPEEIGTRFREAWRQAARPHYPDRRPDEAVDFAWWRSIVRTALDCPPPSSSEDQSPAGASEPGLEAVQFEACFKALFDHYAQPSAWRMFPDVLPTLRALRGKVRLGVLSNFDARLHPLLTGHGLDGFFDPVVISSESAACKPEAAIFARASAIAGCAPEKCLLAGDDPLNDWEGAATAGWQVFQLRRPENDLLDILRLPCFTRD